MHRFPVAALCVAIPIVAVAGNSFRLIVRPELTQFPAVVLQPEVPSVVAFDVLPKGSPQENVPNGFAWQDTCDKDLIADHQAPVVCARVGVKSDRVEFGVRSFNGANPRPIHIIWQRKTVMVIDETGVTINGDLRVTGSVGQ
jgi:hypothetical protein